MLEEQIRKHSASLTLALRSQQYQQALSVWSAPNMAYKNQMRQMAPNAGLKGSKVFVVLKKRKTIRNQMTYDHVWDVVVPVVVNPCS